MNDPEFITDGKEFFVFFNTPMVRGYMPVPIPKADPILHWHGPKIDLVTAWFPALKFMADYVEHEVVLRLFMTRDKKEILIFPLTQIYGTGMSVKEDILKEEREWWAQEGLIEAGTLHSHCNGGAFASSTDTNDERNRDGLHLTVGKLKADQYDLHARMVWTVPGEERDGKLIRASAVTVQQPDLRDWFIFPQHVETFMSLEPELEDSVVKYMLCKPPGKEVTYPPLWKTKLLQRPTSWNKKDPGGMLFGHGGHAYDPTRVAYPGLSMADDIPGHGAQGTKKKVEPQGGESWEKRANENGLITMKAAALWDCWSEALSKIDDVLVLRGKVRVAEFQPEQRQELFHRYPSAIAVWEDIARMLRANHLTEDEFFESWNNVTWPEY